MLDRIEYGNLQVAKELDNFLREEVVPGIDVDPDDFWKSFEKVLEEFGAKNKELLEKERLYKSKLMNGIYQEKMKTMITKNM